MLSLVPHYRLDQTTFNALNVLRSAAEIQIYSEGNVNLQVTRVGNSTSTSHDLLVKRVVDRGIHTQYLLYLGAELHWR